MNALPACAAGLSSCYCPRVSFLSYQSGDTGRALLEFADAYPVDDRTKHHLSIHLANCWAGQAELEERLEWVEQHQTEIKAIAQINQEWIQAGQLCRV